MEHGDIVFVNEGRSKESLIPLLRKLKRNSKSLEAIAIDMNPGYITALQEYLPQVKIVFDRFHIVRMAQQMMDELRRSLQNTMKAAEGNTLKGSRYLLLSNYANLSEEKQHRLKELLPGERTLDQGIFVQRTIKPSLGFIR